MGMEDFFWKIPVDMDSVEPDLSYMQIWGDFMNLLFQGGFSEKNRNQRTFFLGHPVCLSHKCVLYIMQ